MKIIDTRDVFGKGMIAGLIATTVMAVLNLFNFYVIHITQRRYLNFVSVMLWGRKASGLYESIFAQIVQIGYGTMLAITFCYIVNATNKRNLTLKAIALGLTNWFTIYSIVSLFKIKQMIEPNLQTTLSTFVTTSIWGMVTAVVLRWLDSRSPSKVKDYQHNIRHRYFLTPMPSRKHCSEIKPVRLKKPIKIK